MTITDPGCTGHRYAVNPDAPDEGTDIRHDGPCPTHDEADPGTIRAFELIDQIEATARQTLANLTELSDLLGAGVPKDLGDPALPVDAEGGGSPVPPAAVTAPARLPLGEGRKPIWQLLEGELFQFPDGHAFHRFISLDPEGPGTGAADITYGMHGRSVGVTERCDPDTVVSWLSQARGDELLDEAMERELERMDARR